MQGPAIFAPMLSTKKEEPKTFLRRRVIQSPSLATPSIPMAPAARSTVMTDDAQRGLDAARLRRLGYSVPEPVTAYDLRVATTAFQQRVNVPVTGVVDAATREAMTAALAAVVPVVVAPPQAPPVPSPAVVAPALAIKTSTDATSKALAAASSNVPSSVAAAIQGGSASAPIVTAADLDNGFVMPAAGATAPPPPAQSIDIPSLERSPIGVTVEAPDWLWVGLGVLAAGAAAVYVYRRKVRRA